MMDKESSIKRVIAKYRVAQEVPIHIMLTTGEHYYVMLDSAMTLLKMKQIYDRGFIENGEPVVCEEILSPDSYKKLSKFYFKNGKGLIKNSQIIGIIVDEKTMMTNISDFFSKLVEIANKYNLSDSQIAQYFGY